MFSTKDVVKPKQTRKVSLFEYHIKKTLPEETLIHIFSFLEDVDIFLFLFSSKTLHALFKKDTLWKEMISPQFDNQTKKYLKDEDYVTIWKNRVTLDIDTKDMKVIFQNKMEYNSLSYSGCSTYKKLLNVNIDYIYLKRINRHEINQLIREDNDIELFIKASRIGAIVDQIRNEDTSEALKIMQCINSNLNFEGFESSNLINTSDFNFIISLMPYIIKCHAVKSFELFIRAFFIGYSYFKTDNCTHQFIQKGFPLLTDAIFKSNNKYVISKLLELTFNYSNEKIFIKSVVLSSSEKDETFNLLMNVLSKVENITDLHENLLDDDVVCNIIEQNIYFYVRINCRREYKNDLAQFEQAYIYATKLYTEHQEAIKIALELKDNFSVLKDLFDQSHQLENRILQAKTEIENCKLEDYMDINKWENNEFEDNIKIEELSDKTSHHILKI